MWPCLVVCFEDLSIFQGASPHLCPRLPSVWDQRPEQHGPIVHGKNIMDAFAIIEELEESAHIAWEIEGKSKNIKHIFQ